MIRIKNMSMPSKCKTCDLFQSSHSYFDDIWEYNCGITGKNIKDINDKLESCPLVELENYKENNNSEYSFKSKGYECPIIFFDETTFKGE